MKFRSRKRPSPAMIVAVIALSLGLGGSAVAASGVLTKAQVKTVAKKQIRKQAPKLSVASAKRADAADSLTGFYAANVNADGATLGSIPGGVTSTKVDTGVYRVTFPRGVNGCLIHAANGSNDATAPAGSVNVIPVTSENPNRVGVGTYDAAGNSQDRDFYVEMNCP